MASNCVYSSFPCNISLAMNDPTCSVSSALPTDVSQTITPMTNIYVYVDTTWPFYQVESYVK